MPASPIDAPPVGRLMEAAARLRIPVPAFNVPYLPMLEPISEALAACDAFALIEVARLEFTKFEAGSPSAVLREYRRVADRRVTRLHLDHVPVIDEDLREVDWRSLLSDAIRLGFDSVMLDASRLPFEGNVACTAEAVEMAHAAGIPVEAELGAVLGHEEGPLPSYEELFATRRGFTDPSEAAEFVRRTGVDWLSVSIGSIHGAISVTGRDQRKVEARLDQERLVQLREATGVPLVLHGGSGIGQDSLDAAFRNGIVKVNVGTEIRQAYEPAARGPGGVAAGRKAVREAVGRVLREVFRVEGSATRLIAIAG